MTGYLMTLEGYNSPVYFGSIQSDFDKAVKEAEKRKLKIKKTSKMLQVGELGKQNKKIYDFYKWVRKNTELATLTIPPTSAAMVLTVANQKRKPADSMLSQVTGSVKKAAVTIKDKALKNPEIIGVVVGTVTGNPAIGAAVTGALKSSDKVGDAVNVAVKIIEDKAPPEAKEAAKKAIKAPEKIGAVIDTVKNPVIKKELNNLKDEVEIKAVELAEKTGIITEKAETDIKKMTPMVSVSTPGADTKNDNLMIYGIGAALALMALISMKGKK